MVTDTNSRKKQLMVTQENNSGERKLYYPLKHYSKKSTTRLICGKKALERKNQIIEVVWKSKNKRDPAISFSN